MTGTVSPWRIRGLEGGDIDQVVRIWEESRETDAAPAAGLTAVRAGAPAVVAEVADQVVGAAVSATPAG
ncbi:hypothetical protein [Kitasatospora sp. KL5]|uniref:hypothetical protein n=1 Tax=Kitasatospora sp. KL5 TaxID=3425125 RepID=UPI003D6E10CB